MKRSWGLGKVGKDDGALVEKWGEGWVNKVHETKECEGVCFQVKPLKLQKLPPLCRS